MKRKLSIPCVALALLVVVGGLLAKMISSSEGPDGPPSAITSFQERLQRSATESPDRLSLSQHNRTSRTERSGQKPGWKAPLLGRGWRITTGAAEEVGLSDGERGEVQAVVDQFCGEMEASVEARITFDPETSNEAKKTTGYKIKALPDQGADFLSRYQKRLQAAAGDGKGKGLFDLLELGVAYGGYGRYDIDLLVFPSPHYPNQFDISWTSYDPLTHRKVATAGVNGELASQYWGRIFSEKWSGPHPVQ